MPVSGGPYLQAAFFCDRALQEADGVLSFIRIVDRWNVIGLTSVMAPTVIQTTLVVFFKSGIFRASGQLNVTPISPVDQRMPPIVLPILFEGDDERGCGVVLPIGFPAQEPGLYWFEVAITVPGAEPQVKTFIPMRVVYVQQAVPQIPQGPGQDTG